MADNYDSDDDYPTTKEGLGRYWHEQLDNAQKIFDPWFDRAEKVVKRYRDERDATEKLRKKFNILWANTEVLTPSLYGRAAKPEVSRRYKDKDPVGRLASTILERVLEYENDEFPDYDDAMTETVQDRLLAGRGIAWIRYEPVIVQEQAEEGAEAQLTDEQEPPQEHIESVHSPVDYVYWKDFLHSPARKWGEVWWVARWVYMTRKEGEERFGDQFKLVPLSEVPRNDDKKIKDNHQLEKKAKIAEVWDKRTGKVCWVAKDYKIALDERDDPLGLSGFFPCPKPLFATTTNGTLIPVPDYAEYQDQGQELDDVTNRIANLVRAIKAVGVHNSEFKELGRLLSEGSDNKIFPVTNWQALAEKGGLKGAIELLDLTTQAQALGVLYTSREQTKQSIYEICGISDILRGSTKAEETLGAQQLKANFGSLRLRRSQKDVARFASDLFRLKAEIISKFYPPDLILQMSGIMETTDGVINQQLIPQAILMLKNDPIRKFRIKVDADSLAQINEQEEKAAATECITAIAALIQQAGPLVQQAPSLGPMVSEMLLFLVRRYRAGRSLEASIESSIQAASQQAAQPKPDPEMVKAQMQQQSDAQRMQMETQAHAQKAQADGQVQQAKLQQEGQLELLKTVLQQQQARSDAQLKAMQTAIEQRFQKEIAQLQALVDLQIAQIGAQKQASNGNA